ncbi:MAG: hypothetical protein PHO32_07950, partial [Candidatus Cloacimonetes bacterium]|nr:hypothetical protein [Candidatus Cloacimonadota bacterium]
NAEISFFKHREKAEESKEKQRFIFAKRKTEDILTKSERGMLEVRCICFLFSLFSFALCEKNSLFLFYSFTLCKKRLSFITYDVVCGKNGEQRGDFFF